MPITFKESQILKLCNQIIKATDQQIKHLPMIKNGTASKDIKLISKSTEMKVLKYDKLLCSWLKEPLISSKPKKVRLK
jgi:hypothetical protein